MHFSAASAFPLRFLWFKHFNSGELWNAANGISAAGKVFLHRYSGLVCLYNELIWLHSAGKWESLTVSGVT